MAALKPAFLLPGHGPPMYENGDSAHFVFHCNKFFRLFTDSVGEDRVAQALTETASFLESICKQTLERINKGHRLSDIVAGIKVDPAYFTRPYLQPVYDDPAFIIHSLWRHYAGWWDQNPAHLRIGNEAQVAAEVSELAGGPEYLAEKAFELCGEGKLDAASHMIEWAAQVAPDNARVHRRRAAIYRTRVEKETSLMAKGIYLAAQMASEEKIKSTAYYRFEFEKLAMRAAESSDLIYEGSVMRRKALDMKDRLGKQTTGILRALGIIYVANLLLALFVYFPRVSISVKFPENKAKRD